MFYAIETIERTRNVSSFPKETVDSTVVYIVLVFTPLGFICFTLFALPLILSECKKFRLERTDMTIRKGH